MAHFYEYCVDKSVFKNSTYHLNVHDNVFYSIKYFNVELIAFFN